MRARRPFGLAWLAVGLLSCGLPSCRARSGGPTPRPAADAGPRFTDVAAASGLDFIPDRGLNPPLDILQTAGYGGGFLDYDADGWLDVLLVGNPRCRLYRGSAPGRFQDVTEAAGLGVRGRWMGCASADYDGDGWPDLALTGYRTAALLHNDGGRFRRRPLPFPSDHWGTSAAFFDADGDGRLDLYVGCYVRFGAGTPRLCTFGGVRAACSPSHYDPQSGHLYRNLGGRFVEITRGAGLDRTHGKTLGVAACDFDLDGLQDLYLANDGMPGDLFRNLGGGRFRNVGMESATAFGHDGREQAGMGVDWGDCSGDGRPDLVVTTFQFEPTSLYLNEETGVFREAARSWGIGDATVRSLGFGAKFLDVDNNGQLDLVLANGHVQDAIAAMQPGVTFAQPAQLFLLRNESYREIVSAGSTDLRKPVVGRGVAAGDFNNDGRVDLLITNLLGAPLLLRNDTQGSGGWITLRVQGSAAPRDGTGAVVRARIGARTLVRFASTGGGYLSCSDPRVHLAAGAARQIDLLEVRWPGGETQSWRAVPTGREIRAIQGRAGLEGAPSTAPRGPPLRPPGP